MQVPATFDYARAESVEHALELLGRLGPEARVVAGGHSLIPMMKLRLAVPEHLIDINDLHELDYIRRDGDELRIGALTRHRAMLESELVGELFTIFHDAERVIADPCVRNRGTTGGSLCQADPAEDLSAACAAVGTRAVIRGPAGEREVGMEDFHRGPYETAVGEDELLVELRIPIRPNAGSAYEKVERRAGDWAVGSAGAIVWMDGGRIADAGLALAALGGGVTVERAATALRGAPPSDEAFEEAARIAGEDCDPPADQRGPVDYKRHLARELTRRVLRRATARALRQEA